MAQYGSGQKSHIFNFIWARASNHEHAQYTSGFHRPQFKLVIGMRIRDEPLLEVMQHYREYAPDGVQKILIGNKADEEQKRQVGKHQGLKLAEEYGMDFFETSACTNYNIKESFTRLTELVLLDHKKELDGLRVSSTDELNLADLEDDGNKHDGSSSSKSCWC
ncbi:ras-related Rab-15 isoform X2 [Pelobates cultripes]|uniref:small monomeric GTPase n=1 Tax=Pelobates cultripes TaxID=61616 RepID=A0AAD1TIU9_PELCU|nr:ras-related Rab-15 isoform X2 [Pelobates cultripes]